MKYQLYIFIITFLSLISCNPELENVFIPDIDNNEILSETNSLPGYSKPIIDGVYQVIDGQDKFGNEVVLKWNNDYLSIFASKNEAFFVFRAGELDSTILFEGYWRYAQSSESGLVSMIIQKEAGGTHILKGNNYPELIIKGFVGNGSSKPDIPFSIKYLRKLNSNNNNFFIIGHRGGGRNSDRFGASENSVEMIRLAERLGCNGIEIDVKVTLDNIPILFHDDKLSLRLINEKYMIGKVSEYDWKTLRSFCTLKNGEKIPTLREALESVLFETNLKFVWLDIKAMGIINDIAPIQKEYMEKAKAMGKDLEIVLGLPDEYIYNDYLSLNNFEDFPALCEFSFDKTITGKCDIWAPRWSISVSQEQVDDLRNRNIKVFTWTLDEPKFIKTYMEKNLFDGILSNYPMIIAYEYYIKN